MTRFGFYGLLLILLLPCYVSTSQDLSTLCRHYDSIKGVDVPTITAIGRKYVIAINNDGDFKKLTPTIKEAIARGETNIIVRFCKGTYHFHQNHIDLRGMNCPNVSITLEGNGATIIPEGNTYVASTRIGTVSSSRYSGVFLPEIVFLCGDMNVLDVWTPIRQATELVTIIDNNTAKLSTVFKGDALENAKIRVPHWYYSGNYPIIDMSNDGVVCFSSGKEQGFNKDYDGRYVLNYDNRVSKSPNRYQCFNVENKEVPYCKEGRIYFPSRYESIYECRAGQFIVIAETTIKQFNVKGFQLFGGKGGGHYINLSNVNAQRISIINCHLKGIKSTVLMITQTDNVSFINNTVEKCFANGVYSQNGSNNTVVAKSIFKENGQNMIQHQCVYCGGENYHIFDNKFQDFTYSAIFVGVHHSTERRGSVSGIVEGNEICYSKEYFDNYWRYTLADGGAIYITSYNDEVIVRNNFIHDYVGINGNRAIFCDSGAKNAVVYGNVIQNVPNYYAIDMYRVKSADSAMLDANTGNLIFGNYIDGAYKIGGKDSHSCYDGGNILISNPYNRFNEISVSNSINIQANVKASSALDKSLRRKVSRGIPTYRKMKRNIK